MIRMTPNTIITIASVLIGSPETIPLKQFRYSVKFWKTRNQKSKILKNKTNQGRSQRGVGRGAAAVGAPPQTPGRSPKRHGPPGPPLLAAALWSLIVREVLIRGTARFSEVKLRYGRVKGGWRRRRRRRFRGCRLVSYTFLCFFTT